VSPPPEYETPWSVLGLPPRTSDRREIRRAYATLLRRHTPEDDPAGFRRIRSAYEWLISVPPEVLARWGEAADDGDDDGDGHDDRDGDPDIDHECGNVAYPPAEAEKAAEKDREPAEPPVREEPRASAAATTAPPVDPPTAPPPEVGTHEEPIEFAHGEQPWSEPPLLALRSAAQIADRDRRGLALAGALAQALYDHAHGGLDAEEIHQELERLPTLEMRAQAAALASYDALIEAAERGEEGLLAWTAATLAQAEDLPALARLATALEPRAVAVALRAGPWTLVAVTRACAVAAPETARRLLDAAWKEAPAAARGRLDMDGVDLGIAVGQSAMDAKPAVRRLLHRLVWDPADYVIGARPQPEALLREFAGKFPETSPLRALLRMRAPGLTIVHVVAGRGAPAPAKESSGFPWWLIVVVAAGLARALARESPKRQDDILERWRDRPAFDWYSHPPTSSPLSPAEERELERLDALRKGGTTLSPSEETRHSDLRLRRSMDLLRRLRTPPNKPAPRSDGR
jgi:hypothetical protein